MDKTKRYPSNLNSKKRYKAPTHTKKQREKLKKQLIAEQAKAELPLLLELIKHYKIDPNMGEKTWFELSLALSREHVPAFKSKEKPGAKSLWTLKKRLELVAHFEILIGTGMTISNAAKEISKQEHFNKINKTTNKSIKRSPKTLRNVYDNIKREAGKEDQLVALICRAFKNKTNSHEEYIENLLDIATG